MIIKKGDRFTNQNSAKKLNQLHSKTSSQT